VLSSQDIMVEDGGKPEFKDAPPVWVDQVEYVHATIAQIKRQLRELAELHKNHLQVGFDDKEGEEMTIEITTKNINKMFQDCQSRIKALTANKKKGGVKTEDDVMRKNVQASLAVQLQELASVFRKSQQNYLQRLQGNSELQKDSFLGDDDDVTGFVDTGFTNQQMQQVDNNQAMIDDRVREINALAASINDLAVMFKELANLVVDQGSILDRIDYNLEQANTQVEAGLVQLKKANEHQKGNKLRLCILALVLLIIVFAIVLIAKNTSNTKN